MALINPKVVEINDVLYVEYNGESIQLTDQEAEHLQGKNDSRLRGELLRMFSRGTDKRKMIERWYKKNPR